VHAASVGEVKALAAVLERILVEFPSISITLSVMTDKGEQTANKIVDERLDSSRVTVRFLPLDAPRAIERALDSAAPALMLFTETEIWPNWLAALRSRAIPHALINARISESSFKSYKRIGRVMREALAAYERILCQSAADRDRYRTLGAPESTLRVCGNLKNEIAATHLTAAAKVSVRSSIGVEIDDFLLVCGSVRPGEEGMLLDLFLALSPTHPNLKIALAPRHDEMITITEGAARQRMLKLSRFTHEANFASQVIVIDQFGVLAELYGAADLAFVGGTLVEIGGHNLLEPPQAGVKVVFGPSLGNVRAEAEWLKEHSFGFQANDWTELVMTVTSALQGEIDTRISADEYSAALSTDSPANKVLAELRPILESLG
jgi:3-deoxy-D-manno-octulosonic-acid transferase